MNPFAQTIIKLLNHYKAIIRKYLSSTEWSEKIEALELRRKNLREDNEVALYYKAQRVLDDMTQRLSNSPVSYWYSGLDEFHQHFKSILSEYQIEDKKIVHAGQQASRAMVLALQLIKTPDGQRSHQVAQQLDQCGHIIAKYGSLEQQTMFSKALRNFQQQDVNFFLPLLQKFEDYMERFTVFFREEEVA